MGLQLLTFVELELGGLSTSGSPGTAGPAEVGSILYGGAVKVGGIYGVGGGCPATIGGVY